MKIFLNKSLTILKSYLVCVVIFIIAGYIFNTIETIWFCKYQETISFLPLLKSYFNITAAFALFASILLPLYLLFCFVSKKTAQIVVSVIFAILFSLEIGLYMYYQQTGALMGMELLVRPLSETFVTIRNSSNIFIDIFSISLVITIFVVVPFLLKKIKFFNRFLFLSISLGSVGVFAVFTLFYQRDENKIVNNYLESKSYYFFSAIRDNIYAEPEVDYSITDEKRGIEKNEKLLKEYVNLYNNKSLADLDYPMERPSSEFPDILSPFFRKSEKQPNIVIIIVESLGSYLLGDKGNGVTFTSFLDSLANDGLYWKNCLSSSPRTFAAVPSVVGSVPHGIKGFQFGIIPKHHSLFSVLKNNNYATNFFHGGEINFDSMLDFLTLQEIDHIDNFVSDMRIYRKNNHANFWGLHDKVLFDKSLAYLQSSFNQKPNVSVYLTVTSHTTFYDKEDRALKEYYEPKTEMIFSKLDEKQQKYFLPIKERLQVFNYVDDCIRSFIHDYLKLPEFENTIFIITGDHSDMIHKNRMANFSVPLIIWSPLLIKSQSFPNPVSHLSVTPSMISFLQHNYHLKLPEKLAWCSMGLDTSSVFNPSEKLLFLSYDRKVNTMLYNQFYFEVKSDYSNKKLYKIDENLDLQEIKESNLIERIYSRFNLLKYINNYVYHNDKLIKTDTLANNRYRLIRSYKNNNTIVCKTPDTIPSRAGIATFDIMPAQKIKGKYNKIKIKLMADIIINDLVHQNKQMMLNFICKGKRLNYYFRDNITKYIDDEDMLCDKKYRLLVEKEIDVNNIENISVHIYVTTNVADMDWERDKKITLSNMKILISGK